MTMLTILVALRDALVALALSWVGVSIERQVDKAPAAPSPESVSCGVDGVCRVEKPSFNALPCDD